MMVGMAWQIVLQCIGDQSLAIPSVTIINGLAVQTHQSVVLNVIDQFMGNPTDEGGGQKRQDAVEAGKTVGQDQYRGRIDLSPQNPILP